MDLVERQGGARRHPWETARFKFIADLIKKHYSGSDPLVTDIGCGDGFFLQTLRNTWKSGRFVGLDIALPDDEVSSLNANATADVRFFNDRDKMLASLGRPADVMLLMDVIEHIDDDRSFLRDIHSSGLISNDTIVIITVPAFMSLYTSHDDYLKHFRRYSLSEAREVASATGYRTKAAGYFFSLLIVPRFASKLREKIFGPKTQVGIGAWRHGKLITTLIESALTFDARVSATISETGIPFPGLSIYMVCQRQS